MPSTPQDHKVKKNKKNATAKPRAYGSGWKSPLTDLDLPSGEVCQVKRVGVQGLMEAGLLDSVDSLTAIVQGDTIPKAQGKPQVNVKEILDDPSRLDTMMEMADRVVIFAVTQPVLHPIKVPAIDEETGEPKVDGAGEPVMRILGLEERDGDKVYIDYVDDMDKMYIMNFVMGGPKDLQRFREETEAALGGLSAGEAASDKAE